MLIKAGVDEPDRRAVNERLAYHAELLRRVKITTLPTENSVKQIIVNEQKEKIADKSWG